MTDETLHGPVIQVLGPDEHDDYSLSAPLRVLAAGKSVAIVDDEAHAPDDSLLTRVLSTVSLRTATAPPTVIFDAADTDAAGGVCVGDVLRVRATETHLENIFRADSVTVVASPDEVGR